MVCYATRVDKVQKVSYHVVQNDEEVFFFPSWDLLLLRLIYLKSFILWTINSKFIKFNRTRQEKTR